MDRVPASGGNRTRLTFELIVVPLVACFLDKMVRGFRTPTTRGIVGEIASGQRLPDIKDRINNPPGCVHAVVAVEQSRITCGAIVEQGLVARRCGMLTEIRVTELQGNVCQVDVRARPLGVNIERDPFIGLDVNNEPVWGDVALNFIAKKKKWRATKADDDLGRVGGKALADANVKRDLGPTPVIHLEFQCNERVRIRFGVDIRLGAIGRDVLAVDHACSVLAAHGVGEDFFGLHRPNRLEHLHLLVPHAIA